MIKVFAQSGSEVSFGVGEDVVVGNIVDYTVHLGGKFNTRLYIIYHVRDKDGQSWYVNQDSIE